jgi:hypothetical protein
MSTGLGASLNGFVPFATDSPWNKDISASPADANSSAIINFIGGAIGLHSDFGSGQYNGQSIGIPYLIAGSQQALLPVVFTAYGSESDPGPMPIPVNALIEGYPAPGSGDRHVLVLDSNNCFLYELYNAYPNAASWNADSASVWDLTADEKRPYTWTSADAAGLPIFPGLARYDEVAAGQIKHALRFTLPQSRAAMTIAAMKAKATPARISVNVALPIRPTHWRSGFGYGAESVSSSQERVYLCSIPATRRQRLAVGEHDLVFAVEQRTQFLDAVDIHQ